MIWYNRPTYIKKYNALSWLKYILLQNVLNTELDIQMWKKNSWTAYKSYIEVNLKNYKTTGYTLHISPTHSLIHGILCGSEKLSKYYKALWADNVSQMIYGITMRSSSDITILANTTNFSNSFDLGIFSSKKLLCYPTLVWLASHFQHVQWKHVNYAAITT